MKIILFYFILSECFHFLLSQIINYFIIFLHILSNKTAELEFWNTFWFSDKNDDEAIKQHLDSAPTVPMWRLEVLHQV
jgi:hypothetical protein